MDNYFGGGASQFAGGGFMPSPAPGNDNMYGDKQKKSGGAARAETIRAVSLYQVLHQSQVAEEDTFLLDGAPLTNVTVVGRILDVQENATRIVYKVTDNTGTLDMVMHTMDDDEAFMARKRELVPNTLVRVHGVLRRFQQQISMTAYSIRPLTDANEIAFHNLQVIFQSLHLLRGPAPAAAGAAAPAGQLNYGAPQFGGTPVQQAPYNGGAQAGGMAGRGGAAQKTGDPQTDVINVFSIPSRRAGNGLNISQIDEFLKTEGIHYSMPQIKNAIDFLINEGHLFTTCDENHFNAA